MHLDKFTPEVGEVHRELEELETRQRISFHLIIKRRGMGWGESKKIVSEEE